MNGMTLDLIHVTPENTSFLILLISLICNFAPVTSGQKLHSPRDIASASLVLVNKQTICTEEPADQPVILVKSSISHRDERNAIRSTWAHYAFTKHRIRTLFVLGSSQDVFVMKEILREEAEHSDLLVAFANDDYYNLTLKTVFTLFWVSVYCDDRWILYVDDDSLVNPDRLTKHVSDTANTDSVQCQVLRHKPVIRNTASKWFMPASVWNETHYPDYCLGVGMLIPPGIAGRLYAAAISNETQPKLWIDDVFVTGIATLAAGIPLANPGLFSCCGTAVVTKSRFDHLVLFGEIKPASEVVRMWQNMTGIAPIAPHVLEVRRDLPHRSPYSRSQFSHSFMIFMLLVIVIVASLTVFFRCKRSVSVAYKPLRTMGSSCL